MKKEIRASLSDGETSRLQEFEVMTADITKSNEDLRNEIRATLSDGETSRLQEFKVMTADITKSNEDLKNETQNLLKEFHEEQVTRRNEIRATLSDGETSRLQEFEVMMSGIRKDVEDLKNQTQGIIKNFQEEQINIATDWERMNRVIAGEKRKKEEITVASEQEETPEKELVDEKEKSLEPEKKPVIPQEPVILTTPKEKKSTPKEKKSTPKEEKSTPKEEKLTPKEEKLTPKEEKSSLTLQKDMLAFLADHPNGALIGEMEKLLGTPRLKLGRIAKELLEQGKLRKEGNWFFPLSQKPSNQG